MEGMGLISTYTSCSPNDIKEFTYVQYQKILEKVQRKVNFDLHLAYLQFGVDLEKDDMPWTTESKNKKDRVYASDLQNLITMSGGQ